MDSVDREAVGDLEVLAVVAEEDLEVLVVAAALLEEEEPAEDGDKFL